MGEENNLITVAPSIFDEIVQELQDAARSTFLFFGSMFM